MEQGGSGGRIVGGSQKVVHIWCNWRDCCVLLLGKGNVGRDIVYGTPVRECRWCSCWV